MKKRGQYGKSLSEKEKMERIKEAMFLKPGDREEIARIAGYTRQAISVFINGMSNNPRIQEVFKRFVEVRSKELKRELNNIK